MIEALGTSTPTSITVVLTRSRVSPPAKRAMAAAVLVGARHLPMDHVDPRPEPLLQGRETVLGGRDVERLGFRHQRADPIDLRALIERAADALHHLVEPVERHGARVDRLPARRLLPQDRDIHVAEIGEHQRPRDRGRRHHQQVDRLALGGERQPLVDAEAMLLVHHGEGEVPEDDLLLEERVGADHDVDGTVR